MRRQPHARRPRRRRTRPLTAPPEHSLDSAEPADLPTHTAVIAAIPAAEPAVGPHRAHLDRAARWGVPAHVTVLYPFLDPASFDTEALRRLRAVQAQMLPALPVQQRVDHLLLIAGSASPRSWRTWARLPLGR